jgi:RNA polymerase sigma factor (sigma-70 family)
MSVPAFQRLLDEHADGVLRYLVVAVGVDEAPDCFQETVLAALRAYPALRSAENLKGWLFTIARNKALDVHRRRARRPIPTATLPDEADLGALEPEHPVWAAVALLPDRQRDTVTLRYVADLPYAAVGRMLGISEAAARQHAHAAVVALRTGGWDEDNH